MQESDEYVTKKLLLQHFP